MPYIKDEKAKVQQFIDGFPMSFRDHIEFYEPHTLDDAIKKFKHCYEQAKRRLDFKRNWRSKGSGKDKKKWPKNIVDNKEGVASTGEGKFQQKNVQGEKGRVHLLAVDQRRPKARETLRCRMCCDNHRKRDYPHYKIT